MATVNKLEIGAMGFGGKVTLIGCKVGALNRLPASFFVSVAYDCWAFRRLGVRARCVDAARSPSGSIAIPSHPIIPMLDQAGFTRTGREVALDAPLTEEARARAQGRRRRADLRADVHRPRRRALAPDEASSRRSI